MSVKKTDRELAKEIYVEHNGEKPLIEIAKEIGRPPGTVRGWKSKDDWDDLINRTLQKKERNKVERSKKKEQLKGVAGREEKKIHKKIIREVAANTELTDKQQLFCVHYLKYFNATKAYQKAYKCSYSVANSEGYKFLVNPCIKEQIEKLKKERMQGVYLEGKDILQKYIDIAFADVTDFIEFGVEDVPVMNNSNGKQSIDMDGNPIFYKRNYVNFKDDHEVDGTIISEVSQGKDGVKIKLQDKMKALEFLAKNIGPLSEMDRIKIESEKTKVEKLQAEIEKIAGDDAGDEVKSWVSAIEEIAARRSGEDGE